MVAYTTTYSLAKPTVGDDEDVWGGYLNGNFDTLESLLKGTTALTAINVTGNITVGGTVDGRDVAADGTKLDGIESGATADQTAAEIRALVESATDSNVFTDADHTKLNGIETGATADQTASEILTAIKTVDGSGSGLDADTVDGLQASSFLRSDATDTFTTLSGTQLNIGSQVQLAESSDRADLLQITSSTSSWGGLQIRNSSNEGRWSFMTDGENAGIYNDEDNQWHIYMTEAAGVELRYAATSRLNTTSSGANVTGTLTTDGLTVDGTTTLNGTLTLGANVINDVEDIYLRDKLFHDGDTDTYLGFGTNTITLATGGSSEITVDTTGVRLGDTGNGYFQPVSGNYGSIQIDGGAHNAYEGYSIGGRAVFMHNNSTTTGLYNDVDDNWLISFTHGGSTFLRNNGTTKVEIGATYMEMSQHLDMNNNDIYGVDQIFHHGDTNTYIQFHASDQWRVVTGGTERLEVNNTRTQIDRLLVSGGLYEDYDALSGTTPTADPDAGGGFSLTMTGNTTFTFGAANIGGSTAGFVIELTGNGSTVTWPSSVKWAGGTAPDAPASGETDLYVFYTRDGGTTWYGVQSIDAAA